MIRFGQFGTALAIFVGSDPAAAQLFAVSASPPRFELTAEPGQSVRNIIELENASFTPATYTVSTADWSLAADGGVAFQTAVTPGSCRPWVAVEARSIRVPPRSRFRFRFEVTPPGGTQPTECRFAVLFSGAEQEVKPAHGSALSVVGQIGVITYVSVGAIQPQVDVVSNDVIRVGGVLTPVLTVHNVGTAHGRLSGLLRGVDAAGVRRTFTPSPLPILPGETRTLTLDVDEVSASGNRLQLDAGRPEVPAKTAGRTLPPIAIVYPMIVKGTLRDGARSFSFDGTFSP